MTQAEKDRIICNIDDYLCNIKVLAKVVNNYAQVEHEDGLLAHQCLSEVATVYLLERIESELQMQVNIDARNK